MTMALVSLPAALALCNSVAVRFLLRSATSALAEEESSSSSLNMGSLQLGAGKSAQQMMSVENVFLHC